MHRFNLAAPHSLSNPNQSMGVQPSCFVSTSRRLAATLQKASQSMGRVQATSNLARPVFVSLPSGTSVYSYSIDGVSIGVQPETTCVARRAIIVPPALACIMHLANVVPLKFFRMNVFWNGAKGDLV